MRLTLKLLIFFIASCGTLRTRYHVVEAGESFWGIGKKYSVPIAALKGRNGHAVENGLHPGTKLYIPFEDSPIWEGDHAFKSTRQRNLSPKATERELSSVRFSWPLIGRITSKYGRRGRRRHHGIDIAGRRGTSVKAARSGHVIYSGNGIRGYGKIVILQHPDNVYSSVYAHLSRLNVKKGQYVNRGQTVGKVGQTGRASGPHLHFEIRRQRKAVDPLLYLQTQYAANILAR